MAKIQKLYLKNFKSFRNATIPIANGFTAIAGANGTGKSNILDALLFVLGSTSLKLLRASKLVDLVNNTAEDNTARVKIDIKKGKDLFELSRTIDKQGKSIYRMNGKRSSLNETANFLKEVNIQAQSYNIVVQGDVTRIIQMNAKERREIIDEVSGIKEFDEKKQESLKELDKVDSKTKEVRIVLNEREKYVEDMRNEREKAQKWNSLNTELKQSKATLIFLEVEELRKEMQEFEEQEKELAISLEQKTREREKTGNELKELSGKLEDTSEEIMRETEKAFEGIGKSLEEKKSEQKVLEERINGLKEQIAREKGKMQGFAEKKQELLEKIKEKKTEMEEKKEDKKIAEAEYAQEKQKNWHELLHKTVHELSVMKGNNETIQQALKALKKAKASCPTCDQKISEKTREKLLQEKQLYGEKAREKLKELQERVSEYTGKSEKLNELESRNNYAEIELERIERELEHFELKKKELFSEMGLVSEQISVLEKKEREEKEKTAIVLEEVKRLEAEMKAKSLNTKDLQAKKELLKKEVEKKGVEKNSLEEKIRETERKINAMGIEKSRSEVRKQDLEEEFQEFKEEKILEGRKGEELKKRIPSIEKEISSLGAINMKALEDFESQLSELEEIKKKSEKLEQERLSVLEMIEKIEVKRNEVFMNALNEVQKNFSKIFFQFFQGEGKLSISDSSNPLEAGLNIEAKRKGERLKGIDLMSGGEKTLTALAFLFAIQLYNPSPFYVFDEADAALDKENTVKLAEMIKETSKDKQFIAITHNDALIKKADQIVGVALNKQKSSVIGLKLEETVLQQSKE